MPGKYVVSLTHGLDNTDKATVAFVVANAAVASDKETVVFLSIEAHASVAKGRTPTRFTKKVSRRSRS